MKYTVYDVMNKARRELECYGVEFGLIDLIYLRDISKLCLEAYESNQKVIKKLSSKSKEFIDKRIEEINFQPWNEAIYNFMVRAYGITPEDFFEYCPEKLDRLNFIRRIQESDLYFEYISKAEESKDKKAGNAIPFKPAISIQ